MNPHIDHAANGRKRYTPAFRQEAIALIAAGRSLNQISRDLGVSIWTLGEWKKTLPGNSMVKAKARVTATSEEDPAVLSAEIVRLRKALAQSEQRADILKKALAIVGQPPQDSTR
ncbi:MAG: hypothetical protein EOP85_00405 [Verrucomicrobiaceae bacterium]|nr:MAG: hypothetical protein EOP85_00405 [Verrucomicrobiaceae bacterium]